jgi:hypothetical protein
MTEQPSAGLESQIAQLERELQQKRAELGTDASVPFERSEVHAAVGEQIQQVVPTYQVPTTAASGSDVPSWQDPALAGAVQQLVNVAFTQSIQEAIGQAVKMGNPALLDALHDILADQFHQELLNRQKIQPAP